MAKEDIYRKVSLDRLSSPEQVDFLLDVTSSKGWVALLSLCAALAAGLVWGFTGSTATTVSGKGVIVRTGGVFNVISIAAGQITEVRVKPGDDVRPGQVVAVVAQPDLEEKLRSARDQLATAAQSRVRQQETTGVGNRAKLAAMLKQRASMEEEIRDTESQLKFARDQVVVDQQLNDKGLVTRQTVVSDQQKVASFEQNISKLRAQLEQSKSDEVSMQNHDDETSLEHHTKISDLERNVRDLEHQLTRSVNVVTPNGGRVVELKVYRGAIVGAGAPVISIEPAVKNLEVIVYVPSPEAKEIQPGMKTQIAPSGVEREEYGYVIGTVASVGDFPATSEAIQRTFENDSLAKSMQSQGPVTELRVKFVEDRGTVSGFKWSSPKGPPTTLTSGAVCSVEVVTREEPPIEQVLPYLKKKFSLD